MTETTLATVEQQPKPDSALLQFANDWRVTDADTADLAGAKIEQVRSAVTRMKEFFGPLKAAAHAAHKKLTAAENDAISPLEDAKEILTLKVHLWQAEVRRAEQIEAAKRLKEAQRIAAEQQLEEAKQRKAAQEQSDADALALAGRLKAQGMDEDEALEMVMDLAEPPPEPIAVAPVYVAPAPTASKVAGVRSRVRRWNYRITDVASVCHAVGKGQIPSGVVEIKHAPMLAFAKLHGAMLRNTVPGIQFFEEE